MKRIQVYLTHSEGPDGQDVLTIREPLFMAVVADRFVIHDQRPPLKDTAKPKQRETDE